MDIGEKGNHYNTLGEKQAEAVIRGKSEARRSWLKREREARGLSEDACLDCGEPMEAERLDLDLPDCEECRRKKVQNGLLVQEMAFSQT